MADRQYGRRDDEDDPGQLGRRVYREHAEIDQQPRQPAK
jgi:hypothetical protein